MDPCVQCHKLLQLYLFSFKVIPQLNCFRTCILWPQTQYVKPSSQIRARFAEDIWSC